MIPPGEGEWPADQFPDAAADRRGPAADASAALDAGAARGPRGPRGPRVRGTGLRAQGPGGRDGADLGGEGGG